MTEPQPLDPFTRGKPIVLSLNEVTLAHLIREVSQKKSPEDAMAEAREEAEKNNREKDHQKDVRQAVIDARKSAPSALWTSLERVAIRRAAMAIIDMDGLGHDVTKEEAQDIASYSPEVVMRGVRRLLTRYEAERGGIDPLVAAIAAEEITTFIFPKVNE